MANLNYQPDYEDSNEQSFEPLPAGQYVAIITESSMNETKNGTGEYLKLKYEVAEGQYKDRFLFENLNLINQNSKAEAIARRSLNAICKACGLGFVDDSEQLHNIPLNIDVGIKESDIYGKQNIIKKHISINEQTQKPVQEKAEKTQKTSGKAKPWEK